MDITKVHYDPAAAITVKAKKKIPAGTFVVPTDDIVGRTPVVDIAAADAYPFGIVAHDVEQGRLCHCLPRRACSRCPSRWHVCCRRQAQHRSRRQGSQGRCWPCGRYRAHQGHIR